MKNYFHYYYCNLHVEKVGNWLLMFPSLGSNGLIMASNYIVCISYRNKLAFNDR